jgi:cytochrome c
MTLIKSYASHLFAAVLTLCLPHSLAAKDNTTDLAYESAYGKYVDDAGNITLPDDFLRTWVHLGTWAVVEDDLVPDMHSVYAPFDVVEYYRANKVWPDGAMMVKEVRHSVGSYHTTGRAFWATDDVIVWFMMVKDTEGRFPENPIWGEGWGWALFDGEDRNTQIATDYEEDCLGCHLPVENEDWIYLYAYPVLGDHVQQFVPEEIFGDDGAHD